MDELTAHDSPPMRPNTPDADLPGAWIRRSPEDFVVDELPAYGPSGRGEHLLVTFRKTNLTTPDAVRMLAHALGADPRGAGHAGMKDRHAVTTQTVSLPLPLARDVHEAESALSNASLPGIEILAAARHDNKLKPGHLDGNRFTVTLRGIAPAAIAAARDRLVEIGRTGVPNAFGPQRFGRDGDNPERALAWLAGRERGPRDPKQQRLLFSALQSLLFNRVLDRRIAGGTWTAVLAGDLAKKLDSGGIFLVPLEGPELDDARARAATGSITATGPMFGAKMRWPEGEPAAIEREVLASTALGDPGQLEAFRHLGEGTRRPLRLEVGEMSVAELPASDAAAGDGQRDTAHDRDGTAGLVVRFVLPKGGYATTVLGQVFRLSDFTRPDAAKERSVRSDHEERTERNETEQDSPSS